MKSMTGYAYKECSVNTTTVSVEIKSYNNRFLEVSIHLPVWLTALESDIRKFINTRFIRGKVEVAIKVKEEDQYLNVTVNEKAACEYNKALRALAKALDIKEEPQLSMFLGLEGVLETDTKRDAEKYLKIITPVLDGAVGQADAERIREGEKTKEDILSHVSILEENLLVAGNHAPLIEASIKENLKARFTELLGDRIDENRILAETAVQLVKCSISEELSRLSEHLSEFRLETERNPAPGKKLDFLSQEINREINTIGSKTPLLEVSRAVVDMKNALENIREQLRNVE